MIALRVDLVPYLPHKRRIGKPPRPTKTAFKIETIIYYHLLLCSVTFTRTLGVR